MASPLVFPANPLSTIISVTVTQWGWSGWTSKRWAAQCICSLLITRRGLPSQSRRRGFELVRLPAQRQTASNLPWGATHGSMDDTPWGYDPPRMTPAVPGGHHSD
jgi:hypothetical protein